MSAPHHNGTKKLLLDLVAKHPEGITFAQLTTELGWPSERRDVISSALRRMTGVSGLLATGRSPDGKKLYFLSGNVKLAPAPFSVQVLTGRWANNPEPQPEAPPNS
ncbi:MAG: DUF3489 domain-containing protein [Phycisphaerales bacterium]|nr:DUF3489 domain-containing protein [Phycisphaerales bacterium]MBY0263313.1 DUF3489 domain-containing protein [Phycisphaerales bacterium]